MVYIFISTVLFLINTFIFQNPIFGGIVILLYFGSLGYVVGKSLYSDSDTYTSTIFGSLIVIACAMILGSLLFYTWNISIISLTFLTIILPILTWILSWKCTNPNLLSHVKHSMFNIRITFPHIATSIIYVVLAVILVSLLILSRSADPIQTPWEVVSSKFFIVYALATGLLVFSAIYQKYSRTHTVLISVHVLITYAVTNIVYAVAFGFDPFVHQATEKLLLETGTIFPKPLLYTGQYAFVVWLHKISNIAIQTIDTWLVPVLTAVTLPATLRYGLTKAFNVSERFTTLITLSLPIFTLPLFFSVPQNLGNLLLLLTIFLSLPLLFTKSNASIYDDRRILKHLILWLIGITAITVHPFSAIPLLVYVFFVTVNVLKHNFPKYNNFLNTAMVVGGITALASIPVALLTVFNIPSTVVDTSFLPSNVPSWIPFYSPFHLVYLFDANSSWLLLVATIVGLIGLKKVHLIKQASSLLYTILVVFGIIVTLRFIPLPIIAYETQEFINRFWQIIVLFLMPIVFYAFFYISNKYKEQTVSYTLPIFALFLILFITIGMYLTYPRNDAFNKARSFATSQYDVQAVQWIERDAQGEKYVVLSNQAVSASALREYGFVNRYYDGIFYYPIPTTSPLYQLYLDMVYKMPTNERLKQSFNITSAKVAYFVINKYWLDYDKRVLEATELLGKPYHIVDSQGKPRVTIFKLEK